MAFALTTKQIELRGNWLVATVQNSNTEWVSSQLDLNEYIGNREGEFDVTSSGWFNSAKEWSWRLEGTIMFAQLMTGAGWYGNETSINLNLFVKNDDGTLKFQRLFVFPLRRRFPVLLTTLIQSRLHHDFSLLFQARIYHSPRIVYCSKWEAQSI